MDTKEAETAPLAPPEEYVEKLMAAVPRMREIGDRLASIHPQMPKTYGEMRGLYVTETAGKGLKKLADDIEKSLTGNMNRAERVAFEEIVRGNTLGNPLTLVSNAVYAIERAYETLVEEKHGAFVADGPLSKVMNELVRQDQQGDKDYLKNVVLPLVAQRENLIRARELDISDIGAAIEESDKEQEADPEGYITMLKLKYAKRETGVA